MTTKMAQPPVLDVTPCRRYSSCIMACHRGRHDRKVHGQTAAMTALMATFSAVIGLLPHRLDAEQLVRRHCRPLQAGLDCRPRRRNHGRPSVQPLL